MGDKTNGGNIPSTLAGSVAINVPFSLNVMLTSPISSSCCLSKRSNFHCPQCWEPAEHPTLIGYPAIRSVKTLK